MARRSQRTFDMISGALRSVLNNDQESIKAEVGTNLSLVFAHLCLLGGL